MMLPINYKQTLLSQIVELLWKQWTTLGVAGHIVAREELVVDPEITLIFSAHFARYDQRLYDSILDWLQINGEYVNLPRMKALMKRHSYTDRNSIGFMSRVVKLKKWNVIADSLVPKNKSEAATMFFNLDGTSIEYIPKLDSRALNYNLKRNEYIPRCNAVTFPDKGSATLLLRLRGIFGMSARAEAMLTMLNKDFCRIQDVADSSGFSWKAAYDVLKELAASGIVATADADKRGRSYFLKKQKHLHELLEVDAVRFPDWLAVFDLLSITWNCLDNPRLENLSPKTQLAELEHDMAQTIGQRLQHCGIPTLARFSAKNLDSLPEILANIM